MQITAFLASTSRLRRIGALTMSAMALSAVVLFILTPMAAAAPSSEAAEQQHAIEQIKRILQRFDEHLQGDDGSWQLTISQRPLLVVADVNAKRMRIMTPVAEADRLTQEQLYRLMQANFESALDARYAITQGRVWSVFIHPLSYLSDDELISAIAQTVTLAETYGTSFSSGALGYGGGDHGGEVFEALREQGTLL